MVQARERRKFPKSETPEEDRILTPSEYVDVCLDAIDAGRPETTSFDEVSKKIEAARDAFSETEYALIMKRMRGRDSVTGAMTRDNMNEHIKKEILKKAQERGGIEEYANTIGLISFDVRGLKVVNDATRDHAKGDEYLKHIAQIAETVIGKTIQEALQKMSPTQKEPVIKVSRDGGDEFAILISSDVDLDMTVTNEDIHKLFGQEADTILKKHGSKDSNRLMDLITELTNDVFPEFKHNSILPREQLKKHLGEGIHIPKEWEFRSFVAAGGSTLSEVLDDPHRGHFKTLGSAPANGEHALNAIMGALRRDADGRSYWHKEEQNRLWRESKNPIDKFQETIQARNEETNRLIRERDALKRDRASLQKQVRELRDTLGLRRQELENTIQELDECKREIAEHGAKNAYA